MKGLFVVLLLVVAAVLISFNSSAITEKEMKCNFQKAGEELLSEQTDRLRERKEAINEYILKEIPTDGELTKREMKRLSALVEEFQRKKTEAERRLKLYSKELDTGGIEVEPLAEKAISLFFSERLRYGDNEKSEVREIFAELTGQDLRVEESISESVLLKGGFGITGAVLLIAGMVAAAQQVLKENLFRVFLAAATAIGGMVLIGLSISL